MAEQRARYVAAGRVHDVCFEGDAVFLRLADPSVLEWAIQELTRKNGAVVPETIRVREVGHA